MSMLTKDEAQAILKKVLAFSKADECEVRLSGNSEGNIRTAKNAVSTAGEQNYMNLLVSSTFGKKTGVATINEFDDASIEKVVRKSEELAKLAPDNPEKMPLLGPQVYKESITFNQATADITPESRAEDVFKCLEVAKASKLEAAAFYRNAMGFDAKMNSKGLFAYTKDSEVSFSVTIRNEEGTGSGYISETFNDVSKMDTALLTRKAAAKATGSVGAKAIEPGKYTVILEPLAASDLMGFLINGLDARSADEGRSYMSKSGGATRLGEQLFNEQVNIYSDPLNAEMPANTWTDEGVPVEKVTWVKNGKIENLSYSRYWASKKGKNPLPPPRNVIMEGGTASIEDLIKGTDKGILVTRFWYIRLVNPQTLVLTGLTRDGTFYIENGKIQFPIKNFRFNESPIIMLNNLEALGKPVRSDNMIVPPMKVRDFTFTSLSDAV